MLHPQAVTRNAFGDANYYNLCPSHRDARAYVRALVADISHTYQPDRIELESPSFMGFAHEYHHEKDGVGLTPEDDFLLSLCFCPSCVARAAKRPASTARRRAGSPGNGSSRPASVRCRNGASPIFPRAASTSLRPGRSSMPICCGAFEPVTSLVAELREVADPTTRVVMIDLKDGWLGGCDLAALGKVCDGAILCAYDMQAGDVASLMAAGRAALGAEKFLGTGYRLFYPEMASPEVLTAKVKPALAPAVDGINFYNYGLVPAARLDWVSAARSSGGGG